MCLLQFHNHLVRDDYSKTLHNVKTNQSHLTDMNFKLLLHPVLGERSLVFSNIRFEPGNKFTAEVGSIISIAGLHRCLISEELKWL